MKPVNVSILCGVLFVFSALQSHTECGKQSDAEVEFSVNIPRNANIHRVELSFTIVSETTESPSIAVRVFGEAANRAIQGKYPPYEINTDEDNPSNGYLIRFYQNGNYRFEVIKKHVSSGAFTGGTGSEDWRFFVSGLVGPYEIKNVTINSYAAVGDTTADAIISAVDPCNAAEAAYVPNFYGSMTLLIPSVSIKFLN